ncbi:MAG: UDP-N-acetylmuramoyl-L-alanine--D-glutamate ligase [Pseudomonadales bacterium]
MSRTTRTRTLIVGAGMTGLSVLRHLGERDALTLVDTRAEVVPESVRAAYPSVRFCLGDAATRELAQFDHLAAEFDRAVVSPGLDDDHWLVALVRDSGVPLCTDIDLFFAALDGVVDARVIGVTGTNGKSTVTDLTARLFAGIGLTASAGGNLGPAALDLLASPCQVYVLELSSFQLARSAAGRFAAATILNLQPDHLDYHGSMDAYAAAKQRIYLRAEVAVSNRDDAATQPALTDLKHCSFGLNLPPHGGVGVAEQDGRSQLALAVSRGAAPIAVLNADALQLAGSHNLSNVLASLALVMAVVPDIDARQATQLARVLRDYRGLPHRCEPVAELDGVRYINDSKATNVGATVAAVEGLRAETRGQLLLLLGGDSKGADFAALADVVVTGVRAAFVYGSAASELAKVLHSAVATRRHETLMEALDAARELAHPGDCVLLSPACASFDQFANFAARGDAFRDYVQELAA